MSSSLPDIGRVTTSQIDGLEIRLARGDRSDGIPILLTSPWPESIYAFRGVLPAIKELGPLILVDLPGFGRSGSRPDVMSPEAMGDFVIKLAEHLGVGRLHAVGRDSVRFDKDAGCGSGGLQAVFRRPEVRGGVAVCSRLPARPPAPESAS